jgi:tetratricopeptide (TPR) repeat protein
VVAERVRASAVRAEVVAALDDWAGIAGDGPRRVWLLAVVLAADPDPRRYRLRQPALWRDKAALARLAREARVAELSPELAHGLGRVLLVSRGDAVPLLREAQALHPQDFWLNFTLGLAWSNTKGWDEAIGYYQAALALRPRATIVHNNLGAALYHKGRLDEAVGHYEEALRLDPKNAYAHLNLGNALADKGKLDEAVGHYERAIALDPKYAPFHINLGNALKAQGKWDEAVGHYEQALRLDPQIAQAHYCLGAALANKGRLDEAVGHYERAIALGPEYAEAHCNLGGVLRQQGRFEEALACFRRGHELGSKRPGWRYPSAGWVRDAERLAALDRKLPSILKGQAQPSGVAEQLGLAYVCRLTKRYAAAARFYADAFAADPKLVDDLRAAHRYNAACAAALAAAGRGADAPKPGDKERLRLRRQALGWLRAELALWQKQADSTKAEDRAAAQRTLRHWQQDADLAGVRRQEALAALPAEERTEWEKLWAEVADLLRRLDAGKPAAAPAGK